jgi:PHS family inorganic phosphate transporter-like MFS transporter
MLQFRLYDGGSLPADLEGFIKAAANIGSMIGQFAFGALALFFAALAFNLISLYF